MKIRIIVALICVPIIFAVLFFLPPFVLTAVLCLMTAIGAYELLRVCGLSYRLFFTVAALIAAAAIPVGACIGYSEIVFRAVLFLLMAAAFAGAIYLFGRETKVGFADVLTIIFAGAIIPYCLSSLVSLKVMDNGRLYVLLPFISAFISDSGAYFAGIYFGKHKAFPHVSPNKTVEGCVGGMVSGVVFMLIYGIILSLTTDLTVNFPLMALYGLLGNVATQLGDLSFSFVKREFGVKDYGNLIPGHGGILDRFDSMVFAAPVLYLLVVLLPAF